ncbi:MAG: serine/threonine protein kinase [Roseibium sp.]|uniref:serine/threonine protein kinase n=1 Tax=Roseibium sp. TaxID=1936156 RepID=UPI001B2DFFF4|nr:serine/threonine protein kinase [Roseibium sp.]MBO6891759.1 serine/threonine protein kinase [Roseibium sp.]MBO6932303.1 serine/threonine protein kinase [Roseibium sp.]
MRLILFVFGLFLLSTSVSYAQRIYCPLPEDGAWVNPDAAPKEISRIEVESRCENEQVLVRVRAFTSCIPRDCKWGWTKAQLRSDGAIQVLLVGFLSSKQITLRAFGDLLDTHVINVTNDQSSPRTEKTYNLQKD